MGNTGIPRAKPPRRIGAGGAQREADWFGTNQSPRGRATRAIVAPDHTAVLSAPVPPRTGDSHSSRVPIRGTRQGVYGRRARSRKQAHSSSRTESAGSPGSAVFPDRVWHEIISRLGLSHREGEIVRDVFEDQTEFAIAADLGISPHTVHTHFERLRKKLGVADRVQLVLSITHEGLRLAAAPRSR